MLGSPVIYFWRLSSGWYSFKSLDFERGTFFSGIAKLQLGDLWVPFSQRPGKILQRLMGFFRLCIILCSHLVWVSGSLWKKSTSLCFWNSLQEACNLNGCKKLNASHVDENKTYIVGIRSCQCKLNLKLD